MSVPACPQEWLAAATQRTGSWWKAWAAWELERSGTEVPAPAALGSEQHPVLEPAPGSYVVDRKAAGKEVRATADAAERAAEKAA